MPDNKVSEAQKLYVNEIRSVQETAVKWKAFLDFSAQLKISDNQSQYEFATKMIIHAHNPNATDCRLFGEWKTQDGNHVNFREKGIPVLTRDNNGKQSVSYVFDTNQTALHPNSVPTEIADTSKEKVWLSIISEVSSLAESLSFSEEQKRLFKETAEYKLCKQYGLDTDENSERFSGIEKLSEKDIANIGIALNKCSRIVAEIVNSERSKANERNNSKSGEDRSELHGRESRGMDLGGGVQGTRQEVRVRRETEPVVQTKQGERNVRTTDRNASAETNSGNGQVRQHETEIHMANSVSVGNNTEWRRSKTLRGDERESSESDRQIRGEETAVRGIQGDSKFGEISSEDTTVGEIQNGSRGRNTASDSLRNITDSNETTESEKGSVVSACYDKLKSTVISDERIVNAINHSDRENLNIEIEKVLNEAVIKIFNEDVYRNIDFYADYISAEKTENRSEAENYINNYVDEQIKNKQNIHALPDNMTKIDIETNKSHEQIPDIETYEKQYVRFKDLALDESGKAVNLIANNPNGSYFKQAVATYFDKIAVEIYESSQKDSYEPFISDYFGENHDKIVSELYDEAKIIAHNLNKENVHTDEKADTVRTADDIAIGDKYQYKGKEYTVVSMIGVYPDDVGISYEDRLSNGTSYAITENVNKYKLENDGVYLGKVVEHNIETIEPEKKTIPNTMEHRNFKKLQEMFPDMMSKEHLYERHDSKELEPLSLEWIGGNNLSVMHTYTQNGDLMRDPDVVLKVDFENETVNAVSYENSGLGQYREYEDGSSGQRDTNRFMGDWLKNIEQQEYTIGRAITEYSYDKKSYELKLSYQGGNIISVDGDDKAAEDFIRTKKIKVKSDKSEINAPEEPDILGTYAIYQLKDSNETRDYRYISSSDMENQGLSVNKDNYELVYSGELTADMSLDSIYHTFNVDRPDDFIGHSLSMSDIIVLDTDNGMTAHYVDRIGFNEVPEFLLEETVEVDNTEKFSEQHETLDSDINSAEAIKERNLETIQGIEVGDEITIKGETYVVSDIKDDFMMSMSRKDVDENSIETAYKQLIGDWRNQLAEISENEPLIVVKADDIDEIKEKNNQPEHKSDEQKIKNGKQMALFDVERKPYQLITYDSDSGADDKKEYTSLQEAKRAGEQYLKDGYEEYAVYNTETKIIEYETDSFPAERVFSNDVLEKNGYSVSEPDKSAMTEKEKFFSEADICTLVTKGVLAYDEIESLSYPLFEPGYIEKFKASEIAMYGNGLKEPELYDLADRKKNGEDISKELAKGLLGKQKNNRFDFEKEWVDFTMEYGENTLIARCGNVSREVDYKEIGQFFLDKIEDEYKDIAAYRSMEDAFEKLRDNHVFTDEQLKFLNRLENALGNGGYRNVSESLLDVLNAPAFNNTYGNIENIDKLMENKLHDIVSELKAYISNEEYEPLNPAEKQSISEDKLPRFRITDEHLGEGSPKEKFRNNVEAIKTLKLLESEERLPTAEEQEKLSKYIGWGGLQEAFDDRKPSWSAEYYELKNLLSQDEYEAARSTVNDAFYTSPIITNAIYEALDNIGFKGGEILEPSMGIGNFFGTMPDNMRENSNLSGVEIDSISGRIAQKLYPEANIAINGFEKIKFNKSSFDLAIGNVPFGTTKPRDKSKAYENLLIHDYFFAKSLDSVRPGGIVAFVTSTGTLDKEDIKVRQMLAQKAELLGAIRLPGGKDGAFKDNAGTETTTDIIFLKRREKNIQISDMAHDKSCDWVHTCENKDGFRINSYFSDNPQMILGTLNKGNFGATVCKALPGTDLKEQLHQAVQNIKGEYNPLAFQSELEETAKDNYLPATPDVENLTYTVVNDKLYFRVDDDLVPLKESEQHGIIAERRKGLCDLAVTVRELLQAQVENRPDEEIKSLQNDLNIKYDRFVKKYDRINPIETPNGRNSGGVSKKAPNINAFKNDVRLPLLQSLEKIQDGQFVGKTEIFTTRTIRPHKAIEHVDTSHEALILSVSEKGKIDFDYMQNLTGFKKEKIIDDLKGDIFPVPELSSGNKTIYQTSDEYLSGNIYKKIAAAESKLAENPEYADNITALREVIPTPLKATEIDMQLGMTWIDPKIIQQFMYETFETPYRFKEYENSNQTNNSAITVNFSEAGKGSWKIDNAKYDRSVKATKTFGTKDYNAYELLEKILNSKPIIVTDIKKDYETGKAKTIVLEKETRAAEDKAKLIQNEFKKWIFKEPERRNELVNTYNQKFNAIRPRQYDGSSLNFIGSNPEINLKPHQKNAVAHALFGGNTLFAHEVGAGKTFEMIATAMEGKRLGLHNKSMFVVPNHLTEQIGSDFMKLYPNANILVAKPDDFSPQKRRQMCARIATGNFDAVIIGHSQLIKIPLSLKREQEFIQNQINEITDSIAAAKATNGASYTIKELEKSKANLKDHFDKLVNSTVKDSTVTFEELGVDKLFIDEAHEFKNLFIATKMENVSGLATNPDTQKTQDLYMKCQYLDEITNSKGVVFATGTPVTNALSEMFIMMKYLQNDLLKETGLDSFDSWAGNFTKKINDLEIAPSGNEWRNKTRLKFTNVPELVTMFKECADIKMADQLDLDVPECKKEIVAVEPTEIQKSIVESLGERAEKISQGAVSRTQDNMLLVVGDGRKLGLDQRLFDPDFPDEPQSKINHCINNVHDIWEKTAEKKSTQLIFCDLGVPQSKEDLKKKGKRFDVYADIKNKLIQRGIPEKEIAFIHEADSETKKARLFAKVRSGDVRILIGSTQKMGAGTNVQNKLVALHDLDCPWRPADLTQRLGRMVRQGNENDNVCNYRYVTKGTLDAYLYQTVEKKQDTFSRIFTSKDIPRTCDDIDDMAGELQDIKIAAIGDERIKKQAQLRKEIAELKSMKNHYLDEKYELEDNVKMLPDKIAQAEVVIHQIKEDTKTVESFVPKIDIDGKEKFEMKVNGTVYEDKKEAAEAFKKEALKAITGNLNSYKDIAEYKGFKIAVAYDSFTKNQIACLKGANSYHFELGKSETGNITRIDNMINSVPKRIDEACNELQRLKTELDDSIAESQKPFAHEAELQAKEQELQQLTDEINADKLNGKIAPNQPESTEKNAISKDNSQTANKVELTKSSDEPVTITSDDNTNKENFDKNAPDNLNLKWKQNGKEFTIAYDSKADGDKVSLSVNGKIVSHCSPERLEVCNPIGNYPPQITKGINALNVAFSENTAIYAEKFIDKVKVAHEINSKKPNILFSRERIMSDEFKPKSEKNQDKPPEHGIGG